MKASELRIGNLIGRTDYICVVTGINKDGIMTEPINYTSERLVLQSIKPIPLTEEILTKWLGLKKDWLYEINISKYKYPAEGETYIQIKPESEKTWSVYLTFKHYFEQSIPICKNAKLYIHQLQNFYFDHTGKELGIKIPKVK